jgi:hypothetical protein
MKPRQDNLRQYLYSARYSNYKYRLLNISTTHFIILYRILSYFIVLLFYICRSHWARRLRRRSAAARLLRLWVQIPPGTWMFVCCGCCVLSGRGLSDGLITRPEESYLLLCVNEEALAHRVFRAKNKRKTVLYILVRNTGMYQKSSNIKYVPI